MRNRIMFFLPLYKTDDLCSAGPPISNQEKQLSENTPKYVLKGNTGDQNETCVFLCLGFTENKPKLSKLL